MNEQKGELTSLMQEHWDIQAPLFARIKERGGFAGFAGSIEHLDEYFNNENRNASCIDERAAMGIFRYAGSGILDQEKAAARFKEAGMKSVYSHAGCGAAALAYERLSDQEKIAAKEQSDPEERFTNPEEYAVWWAKKVAKEAGINYAGHLPVSPNFHIARVAYYDGTGTFDAAQAKDFPPGFVISRRYLDKEYASRDLKLSVDIAFGHHGFGKDRFSQNAPFTLVIIGDPNASKFSLETLREEVKDIAEKFGADVVVDGFVAPTIVA